MVLLVNPWKLWRHADPTTKRSPPPTVVPMVKMEIEEPLEEENWFINKRLRNPNNLQQLPKDVQGFEAMTKCHIDKYSEASLRTVVLAYRVLREEEYKIWHDEFSLAKSALCADHNAMVESAAEKFERDLILLGAAVEDRL